MNVNTDASELSTQVPSERPREGDPGGLFGSDLIADTLRDLGVPYVALVPGSSLRGLHDSIINRLGNSAPQMIVCLHEDASVAIAHGYGKITGRAMAAALHSNVGLMHAVMGIYNAYGDRAPVLLLGATGPVDAKQRRPWIDWIHCTRDQAALIRGSVKWDDQPGSAEAARDSVVRAKWISETVPKGPAYVNLEIGVQEERVDPAPRPIDVNRLSPAVHAGADQRVVSEIAELLSAATRPVILMGRLSRNQEDWAARVALAEALGAPVATSLKAGASFPTEHELHMAPPGTRLVPAAQDVVREADVILSLDWIDLAGSLSVTFDGEEATAKVIHVSRDHVIHNGVHMDHQAQPSVDLFVSADPDQLVPALVDRLPGPTRRYTDRPFSPPPEEDRFDAGQRTIHGLAAVLWEAMGDRETTLTNLPLPWHGRFWPFRHPLDYAGGDGASGIGGGPGIAVGEALALKGRGRLPVCICGDGDFVMGHTAIWTAVHYRLPLLFVVANNCCYFNDVKHQAHMAESRGRQEENKWIGQMLTEPDIDLAALGRAQGAVGFGPVHAADDLEAIYREAIKVVDGGGVAVVDVRIKPGYAR
jgi:thiamine pyrophosphate-dependent acetolactate synthase large subunit-like protein